MVLALENFMACSNPRLRLQAPSVDRTNANLTCCKRQRTSSEHLAAQLSLNLDLIDQVSPEFTPLGDSLQVSTALVLS